MLIEQIFGENAFTSKHEAEVYQRTELGRWAICPQQAKLCEQHDSEIDRHEILPETGRIVHAIAEMAIKFCDYSLQDASDMITEELPKARPDLQPEALRAGRSLARWLREFSACQVLLCEQPVTRSLLLASGGRGETLILSELDLVLATGKASAIIVLDYKTGYKQRANQEAKDDFQTCVGAWVLFGKYPDVQTIHWWYLETRTNTRAYARIERERDELNFQARILETVRIKLSGTDEAWPNLSKCAMCPVTWLCKECSTEAIPITEDPKSYLDAYIVKQTECDNMLLAMKAHVKGGKCIYGTNSKYEFNPKPKFLPKLEVAKLEKPKKKTSKR